MKQRRTILILGVVALLVIGAIVLLATYYMRVLEKDKNRQMTEAARKNRHAKNGKVVNDQSPDISDAIMDEQQRATADDESSGNNDNRNMGGGEGDQSNA